MLELALRGLDWAELSGLELRREGPSYTIDTVRTLQAERPEDRFTLLIGMDNLGDLHRWRGAEELLRLVRVLTLARPGSRAPARDGVRRGDSVPAAGGCAALAAGRCVEQRGADAGAGRKTDQLACPGRGARLYSPPFIVRAGMQGNELVETIVSQLQDLMGQGISVLDMRDVSSVADFFVIVSGNSTPHLNALNEQLARHLKGLDARVYRKSGTADSGWLVLDFVDVVVHIMDAETRAFYDLEDLWSDAPRMPVADAVAG